MTRRRPYGHACGLCGRRLPTVEEDPGIVFSPWTRSYYCGPKDEGKCESRRRRAAK